MSFAMSREDAQRLHSILDDHVGVFRMEYMSDRAENIRKTKEQEFLELYSTEIPEEYWFQGFGCNSAHLVFGSASGLRVESRIDESTQEWLDEKVNPLLRSFNHYAVDLMDDDGNIVKGHDS